jgi:cell division protein FtsZ
LSVSSPISHNQEAEPRVKVETPVTKKVPVPEGVEGPVIVELTGITTAVTLDAEVNEEADLEIPSAEEVREATKIAATEEVEAEEVEVELVVEPVIDAEAKNMVEAEEEQIREDVIDQGEPAPATPGQNTEDAFIPEAPICSTGEKAPGVADPFAAAAMTNGSKSTDVKPEANEPKTKKQSLFERVTGLAGSTGDVAETVPFEPKAIIERLAQNPKPVPGSVEVEEQNQLGGMDEAERITSSQEEPDLLDIPAFLRRQAN